MGGRAGTGARVWPGPKGLHARGGAVVHILRCTIMLELARSMATDAELRKAARAKAELRVFREQHGDAEADFDAFYWDRIPIDERAALVWELSLELHALSNPEQPYEPRLSRSIARVVGR